MEKKIIDSIELFDYEILTDTGWKDVIKLHKTIEYQKYIIKTEQGLILECADNHILFTENFDEIFVKDLKPNSLIITENGVEKIVSINITNEYENMYDFELPEGTNHRYYTNGILSHNTYLVQNIAKMLDIPVAMVDATVLTQAGYVGEDIESCISRLLQAANYDVEKAERGIVFIDEIDKIGRKGSNPSITRDVSGEGVQQGLLKLLEGSIVNVAPQGGRKHPDQKYIQVNTKNVLFICAGAFEGIEDKIGRRHNIHAVGYNADNKRTPLDKNKMIEKITAQDLKSFGLIPEIIGRLPVITYVEELDEAALKKILTEPKNALVKQYQELFKIDGIELTFDKKVFDLVAKKAVESKTGARGLRSIMEDLMNKLMFELPSKKEEFCKYDKDSNIYHYKVTLAYAKKQLEEK